MRFIELHNREGKAILVNVHQILTITRYDDNSTDLTMADGVTFVQETPDEILMKIRG